MATTIGWLTTRCPGILASAASLLLLGSAPAMPDEHDTFEISIGGYDTRFGFDNRVAGIFLFLSANF